MSLKKQILKGTFWSAGGQVSYFLIILLGNIWMARLLTPSDFGKLGIIMFFITLFNVLTESGLGGALIQKKNPSKLDYSTVFVVNLVFSCLCLITLIFFSSSIAIYYKDDELEGLLIASSFILLINSFQFVQIAKLTKEMRFKQKYIYRLIAVLIATIIGIIMGYYNFGVWALLTIQICSALINVILLFIFEDFNISLRFSKISFKSLYAFGINTTLVSLINVGFDNIYQLILGKYFSIAQTGYFYQAKKLQNVPGSVINIISQTVVFSGLTNLQNDKAQFAIAYNKITSYFLVLFGLITCVLYTFSEPIILILFGEKWFGAIYFMKLLAIASFFYMQENVNRIVFKVFNETQKLLWLEVFKKIIQACTIIIGVYYKDLNLLILGYLFTSIIGYFVNYYYSRKIINEYETELISLLKVVVVTFITILASLMIMEQLNISEVNKIIIIPISISLYFLLIYIFKIMNVVKEAKGFLLSK